MSLHVDLFNISVLKFIYIVHWYYFTKSISCNTIKFTQFKRLDEADVHTSLYQTFR